MPVICHTVLFDDGFDTATGVAKETANMFSGFRIRQRKAIPKSDVLGMVVSCSGSDSGQIEVTSVWHLPEDTQAAKLKLIKARRTMLQKDRTRARNVLNRADASDLELDKLESELIGEPNVE